MTELVFYRSDGVPATYGPSELHIVKPNNGDYREVADQHSPAASYLLAEAADTTMIDSVANWPGTYVGTPHHQEASLMKNGLGNAMGFQNDLYGVVDNVITDTIVGLSLTFKITGGSVMGLIGFGTANAARDVIWVQTGGAIGFLTNTSPLTASDVTVNVGETHHLVVTRDGGNTYMYVDGVKQNSATTTHNILNTALLMHIGTYFNNDLTSRRFQGVIDDVDLYTNVLSDADVLELYEATVADGVISESNRADLYFSNAAGNELRSLMTSDKLNDKLTTELLSYSNNEVVANITARDALTLTANSLIMVADASDDPTVTSGAAMYFYDVVQDEWTKVYEDENIDLQLTWANLVGKPTSSVAAIDQAVTDSHSHANAVVLGGIAEDGTTNNMTYNSKELSGNPEVLTEEW